MNPNERGPVRKQRARMDLTTVVALIALAISGLGFYRSYIYTKQDLSVTVTEVSVQHEPG